MKADLRHQVRPAGTTSHPAVAVIDIGSNSIKVLVATRGPASKLVELAQRTEETRIGTGIAGIPPRLQEDAMRRAIGSVRSLLADAMRFAPREVRIVATSAVRDAANRADFASGLLTATGQTLVVLTGDEEARLIGRGISCDPALRGVSAFYLFDLGGGSLEILEFHEGRVRQLMSLPLGCVRVTELCVKDPGRPLAPAEVGGIQAHVRATIAGSGFRFNLPPPAVGVFTGGTATTFRVMKAAAIGIDLPATPAVLHLPEMEQMGSRLAALGLVDRRAIPGMPPGRADVFPAALLTLVEVARIAGVAELRHSFYNLRYGLADELLAATD